MSTDHKRLLAWGVADVAVLVALRPHPLRLSSDLAAPEEWIGRVGPDAALAVVAAAALWLVAVWLGVGLLAALAGRLPGSLGRLSTSFAAALLPRVLYRVAAGSAGLGILLGPVVAAGADPAPPHPSATGTTVPAPIWPSASSQPTVPSDPPTSSSPTAGPGSARPSATSSASPTSVPAPAWPQDPGARPPASSAGPVSSPAARTPTSRIPISPSASNPPTPGRTAPGRHRRAPVSPASPHSLRPAAPSAGAPSTATGHARTAVAVHADDSLWLLAAHRLGPNATAGQIAHEWPRWYAANRSVIGADPNLIRPGQVLQAPAASSVEAR